MKNQLLATILLLSGGAAMAQAQAQPEPYAKIVEVEGLVTVTTNNQLSNAVKDMPLVKGGQVLTTGSGTATVGFSNGCQVTLAPGQTLLVEEEACKVFVASSPPSSLITPALVLLGAGSLAVLAVRNANAATPAVPGGAGTPAIPAVPASPVSGS
jgi:Flp pilus assembly protein TadG